MKYIRSLGGIFHPASALTQQTDVGYATCKVCELIWSLAIVLGCAYLVFFRSESGWWFLLAIFLASSWSCERQDEVEDEEDDE